MPSPFPGMDPYLEHPTRWPGAHQALIAYMNEALNFVLPPGYAASIGERIYVLQPDRSIYPDLSILEHPGTRKTDSATGGDGGGAATAVADPPLVLTYPPVELREVFIDILALGEDERLVTAIEVLSHVNKTPGSQNRDLYLMKQRQILSSDAHLLEIDLLRTGTETVAAFSSNPSRRRDADWDYLVCLHRVGAGDTYEAWPGRVRERLPRVAVPLSNGDPDVALDLQAIFDRCYDAGPYRRRVDYRREPIPELRGEDAVWADALLREKGLRS